MSGHRILVTGGAGFIGSHLVDRLVKEGHTIRVLDVLLPQVHAKGTSSYVNPDVEFLLGDVRDTDKVRAALENVDIVVHLAAAVGIGQSMYEIVHYSSVNVVGTATLLEILVKERARVEKFIVASSMSVYGEGRYACARCGPQDPEPRPGDQLERRDWAMYCPGCCEPTEPRPTPESKPAAPTSVYAMNKRDQEEMVLNVGKAIGFAAIALRLFNVYGERQALSNPYTGVGAIFSSALLNGRKPLVFEDGQQLRDFVHVSDVVDAFVRAIESDDVRDAVLNVGTGHPTNLLQLAGLLARAIPTGHGIEPEIVGRFRQGDIRACYADITRGQEVLGFSPKVSLEDGVKELAAWVSEQSSPDGSRAAAEELRRHGLLV